MDGFLNGLYHIVLNRDVDAPGANFFKVDLAPFPTVRRIVDACMQNDAFARAHPLRQPGAPASV